MPELTFEAATALVAAAEKRFDAKDYDGTATVLEGILEAHPAHYWALLLLARTRRKQGDVTAATNCLRSAIGLAVPERVGAYFDLAFHLLAEQLLEAAAPLIEAALRLPDSNQTRWYKGRLLFLRALVALGEGRAEAADAALADAYRFERGIDETPLLFGWVREAILRTDCGPELASLHHFATRIGVAGQAIVHRDERRRHGADTRAEADFAAGRFAAVLAAAQAPTAGGVPAAGLLHLGGKAALRLARPVDAAGLLQLAVTLAPADDDTWCDLGEAWYALRQFPAADQAWGNVAELARLRPTAARRRKVARILSGREAMDWSTIRRTDASPASQFWVPDVAAAVPDPAERLPMLVWLGEARRSEVCLTIDDGPSPDITPLLLEILQSRQLHAAFFLLGGSVARYPELAQRIAEDGHEIYSHSYSHKVFTDLDEAAIVADLSQTEELLSRLRPTPSPYPIRLPGGMGWDSPHVHRAIRHWNPEAILVHWTINPEDWAGRASIALHGDPLREARVRVCETALDPALGGAIVLAHDCLIGLPRTSTDYIRHFVEGLAEVVSGAHLTAAPLFPLRRTPLAAGSPAAEATPQAATMTAPPVQTTPPSTGGQDPVDVVRVDHTNWARFTSTYELNGAPVPAWRRTLAQPWVDPSRPIAYVLVDGRKCVGWLQTIYADTHFGDGAPPTLICSLSGWYVQENYRYRSLSLILQAMIDADAIPMTVFTASQTAARIYAGLQWRLLDNERWTIPLTERRDGPALTDDFDAIFDRLTPGQQRVLNDHRSHGLHHAMIALGDRYCYFSYLVHERLNQQVADIVFLAGEADLLLEPWHPAAGMKLLGCDVLHIDCRYLGDGSVNLPRARMWGARMYHGPAELRNKLSMLYSEVPIYQPALL